MRKTIINFLVLFLGIIGYAQTLTPNLVKEVTGDFTMIGNSVIVDDNAAEFINTEGGAFNSSSAVLSLPVKAGCDAEIAWAGLYWHGMSTIYAGPKFGFTSNAATPEVVRLKHGNDAYHNVTGEVTHISGQFYYALADVTDYVKSKGLGKYSVADIATKETAVSGVGKIGGWTLVVIYQNETLRAKKVQIYKTGAGAGQSRGKRFNITGLSLPPNGPITPRIGIIASDGETNLGDYLRVYKRDGSYQDFAGRTRSDGFFNSTTNGVFTAALDAKYVDANNSDKSFLSNTDTSFSFETVTSSDVIFLNMVIFSVENFVPLPFGTIGNTQTGNITLNPGDKTTFRMEVTNNGDEPLLPGSKVYIPMPNGITAVDIKTSNGGTAVYKTGSIPASHNNTAKATTNGYIEFTIPTEIPVYANLHRDNSKPTVHAFFEYEVTLSSDCGKLEPGASCSITNMDMQGFIRAQGKISQRYTVDTERKTISASRGGSNSCNRWYSNNNSYFSVNRNTCNVGLTDISYCNGATTTALSTQGTYNGTAYNLNFLGNNNITYQWTLKNSAGQAVDIGFGSSGSWTANGTNGTFIPANKTITLPAGADRSVVNTYTLEIRSTSCSDVKKMNIVVNPIVQGNINTPAEGFRVCSTGTLQLSATNTPNIIGGTWSIESGTGATINASTGLLTTTNASGTIRVKYQPPSHCGTSAVKYADIIVDPAVSGSISVSKAVIKPNESQTISIKNTSAQQVKVVLKINNGEDLSFTINANSTTNYSLPARYLAIGDYTITGTIRNATGLGCEKNLNEVSYRVAQKDADLYTPVGQVVETPLNVLPQAKGSIFNTSELPSNTTYSWETAPVVSSVGLKDAVVKITFADGSSKLVPVKVFVYNLPADTTPPARVDVAPTGNVGINTDKPQAMLDVREARSSATETSKVFDAQNSTGNSRLTILKNGNVGLNTNTPAAPFHIKKIDATKPVLSFENIIAGKNRDNDNLSQHIQFVDENGYIYGTLANKGNEIGIVGHAHKGLSAVLRSDATTIGGSGDYTQIIANPNGVNRFIFEVKTGANTYKTLVQNNNHWRFGNATLAEDAVVKERVVVDGAVKVGTKQNNKTYTKGTIIYEGGHLKVYNGTQWININNN